MSKNTLFNICIVFLLALSFISPAFADEGNVAYNFNPISIEQTRSYDGEFKESLNLFDYLLQGFAFTDVSVDNCNLVYTADKIWLSQYGKDKNGNDIISGGGANSDTYIIWKACQGDNINDLDNCFDNPDSWDELFARMWYKAGLDKNPSNLVYFQDYSTKNIPAMYYTYYVYKCDVKAPIEEVGIKCISSDNLCLRTQEINGGLNCAGDIKKCDYGCANDQCKPRPESIDVSKDIITDTFTDNISVNIIDTSNDSINQDTTTTTDTTTEEEISEGFDWTGNLPYIILIGFLVVGIITISIILLGGKKR